MENTRVVIFLVVIGICFVNAEEGSVYFIAGGSPSFRDIELYHPTIEDLKCTITPPQLNNDWRSHMTFYHDNTIYLCGGYYTKSICISHSKDIEGWKVHTLSSPRQFGDSTVILENTLYIIGGRDGINNNDLGAFSTPLPLKNQPVLTSVPNLSYKGRYQCVAKEDSYNLIVTGGANDDFLTSVIQYNAKTSTATILTSLKEGRYGHGCVVAEMDNKKYLIVTGGHGNSGRLQTTEMIDLEGNSHVSLGNLQTPRRYHSMLAANVGVLVIGGYDGSGATKTAEILDWTTKKWKQFEPSIKTARYVFGEIVEIDSSLFDCLGATTTTTPASTTPIGTCPPPPTCPTSPPPSTCPTVPAPQTCPTTPLPSTCPPTPTCPTCPDKTCPPTPTYPTPPTCPPTPTCPDKTCPLPSTSSPPTCPPTPTCPTKPEIPTPPTISTCSEKSCPACPTEIAIGTTTSIMADTCYDTGCKNAFNGLGMCVDTSSADFGNVSKSIDFAAGTKEGKCSKDCNCNCFKHTGCYSTKCDESHGICLIPEEEENRGFFIPNEYSKAFPCDASLNCHCYIKDGVTRSPPEKKEPLSKASCKPSKKCKKSKGNKCFREEDAPKGAQAKGWCNKKKKCRCYKV